MFCFQCEQTAGCKAKPAQVLLVSAERKLIRRSFKTS